MNRTFLVAYTASCSMGILTQLVTLHYSEKANKDTFERILNAILKPSYVKNIISWSLTED